jgi:hypothetical protein
VHVGHHVLAKGGFTLFYPPVLSDGNEELLVTGEAVLDGSGLAREGGAVRVIGGGDTGEVSNVFLKRLLTFRARSGKGL